MMAAAAQVRNTAQNLMLRAIELLDDIREMDAALHLQQAIDTLTDAPIPRTPEEADALLDSPNCHAILKRLDMVAEDRTNIIESDESYYERRAEEQLTKASSSDDSAIKVIRLDIAAQFATLRELAGRARHPIVEKS